MAPASAPSLRKASSPVLLLCALGALAFLFWHAARSRLPPPATAQQLHAAAHACPAEEGAAAAGAPGSAPAARLSDGDEDAAVQATFERVYRERKWGDDGGGSGAGSTVSVTRYARLILELVVHKYALHSIVDAPCGAMVWMPVLLAKLRASVPCLRYTGVDIVRPVIAANVARFAREPWMSFAVADFTVEDLPTPPRSVIFCRDALQHLSMPQVFAALRHMASSLRGDAGRFLLVGSYSGGHNRAIRTGEYFHINVSVKKGGRCRWAE
jgi:hypothetical protein